MENNDLRKRIIGLGDHSFKKSYYPELQNRISELNLFKSVFDQVIDMVLVIKPQNGIIDYFNHSANTFFGLDKQTEQITIEHVLGVKYWNLIRKDYIENENSNTFSFKYRQGELDTYIEISASIIESNKDHYCALVIRDITQSVLAEKEIIKAKNKAEEGARLKSAFLANMSHEIRTPMNGIVGFISLLDETEIDVNTRSRYMEIIKSSCDDLLRIIDDILDISKIESGSVNLHKTLFNFSAVLEGLNEVYNLKLRALNKPVRLIFDRHDLNNDLHIFADGVRVKQVLRNLIDNAIKFTHEGTITVAYRVNNNSLHMSVSDTGIGILPEKQKVIFERFRQSEDEISRNFGGTGLGLSICKGLLTLMGGSISVSSEYGKGAVFTFQIPLNN